MTRTRKIILRIALALAALVLIAVMVAIHLVQTEWFRNLVTRKAIAAVEDATGGRAEVGSFRLDWRHLEAVVTDFVLHGDEPPGAAPLLRVPRARVNLRLLTSLHHLLDITYLEIDNPAVNVLVLPSGRSNIPSPKQSLPGNNPPLQSVVDTAIGRLDLNAATIAFDDAQNTFSLHTSNFRAQLLYSSFPARYHGELSFQPVYVSSGRNMPVRFTVTLPVVLESDRVSFDGASITSPASNLQFGGSIENLRNPKVAVNLKGRIALEDVKNLGGAGLRLNAPGAPASIGLEANATISSDAIQISRLHANAGATSLDAAGALQGPGGRLQFQIRAALNEVAMLTGAALPAGIADLSGAAKINAGNVDIDNLRLKAFGATVGGTVSLRDFRRFQFHGDLQNLTIQTAASLAGEARVPYAGTIQGSLAASGDLKAPNQLSAQVDLAIAARSGGIPVHGRLAANYNQAAADLRVENSYVILPHSRVDIDGSAGRQLNVSLSTSDLSDLLAAVPGAKAPPVDLAGHTARFTGSVTGGLRDSHIAGHLRASGFRVQDRSFDTLALDASVSPEGVTVENAQIARAGMQAQFSAHAGMKNWKIAPEEPVALQANVSTDLADVLAFAGQPVADSSGALTVMVQVGGTAGNPSGSASVLATNGMLRGEAFDRIQAQLNLSDQLADLTSASADRGSSHLALTAQFRHPRDSFTIGQLHAHVESNTIDLAQLRAVQQARPDLTGTFEVNADAAGDLGAQEFMLGSASGVLTARNLKLRGESYGDLTANARSSGKTVQYQLASTFAGSNIRVTGNTRLEHGYPTAADVSLSNLPVERLLQAARLTQVSATGTLSGSGHFSGTAADPSGSLDLSLAKGELYNEPLDSVRLKASYEARTASIQQLEATTNGSRIELTARFDHPQDNFKTGNVQFHVSSSNLNLARVHNVQLRAPGVGGTVELDADGAGELRDASPKLTLQNLKANLALRGVTRANKTLGDATLTAATENNIVNIVLASNLIGAQIQGQGSAGLAGAPAADTVKAQLSFTGVSWARIQEFTGSAAVGEPTFDATTDGQITVQGPLAKPEDLQGSIRLTRLEVTPSGTKAAARAGLKNQEPISLTLGNGVLRIDSAHLTGPQTDLQAQGTLGVKDRSLNLTINGNGNVGVLQTLDRDISSSGKVVLAATVRGVVSKPNLGGSLQLQNVSVNDVNLPNGISNATGTVNFNGSGASLQNLTAQVGGGKVTLTGFAVLSETPRFGLRATASRVRLDVQQGVSVVTDADLNLTGTTQSSMVSGRATITRINYTPQTDIGSILTRAAPSVENVSAPSPLLDNMKLDVQVRSSSALAVQSSLAQSLEGTANLLLRGTASHPAVTGRVDMTGGKVTFFGNGYTVDSGNISFYNPVRIDPVLDVSLETNIKGVDVTLRVTGPIENLKLSYTSDPPLQFEEIVGLLAAGTTPTSDPTLLANNPPADQNITQIGESAVLGNAVANPVASRLQRVFGITQLKIDPAFTNGSETPEATLSLQQQIASNITFTYVTEVNNANAETIRVEVTLNPEWSAAAMRDDNGIFSINLFYKRQFR